jgi:Domain of unknown function (DUF4926)
MGSGDSPARDGIPADVRRSPVIDAFSDVVLLRDMPEHGLRAGDVGVVVEVFPGRGDIPPGYIIEFITLTGETVAVIDLTTDAVRPVSERDMPQARAIARR